MIHKKFSFMLPLLAAGIFLASQTTFAQDFDREALKAELKEEILAEVNETVWDSPLLGGLKNVSLSGFLDVNYFYSFKKHSNSPQQDELASGLNFIGENENNSLTFESFTLFLDKEATEEHPIGWQLHTYFGEKAKRITFLGEATPRGTNDPDRDDIFTVATANISWIAPIGKGLTITAGKMYTWIGLELVENIGNPNYQHGTLYNNAIPFTHTGIKAGYDLTDNVYAALYLVNGWDSFIDNNSAKSLGWYISYTSPSEKTFVSLAGIHGAEGWDQEKGPIASDAQRSSSTGGLTQMFDLVASYQLTNKLKLMFNGDWGVAEDAAMDISSGMATGTTGHWWGVAGYSLYDFTDWFQGVVRYEYLDDTDGVRWFDTSVWDVTVTANIKVRENLLFRPEFRYINFAGDDSADEEVIVGAGVEYLF
ncbi:porin [Candidatus Kuenenia stuttgartiensis]|uniref:Porin n=1 Tax=Kuenenia stuttgartiensis TaxID=174633 RepID=Q1PUL0_KUEST|nr:MULTISPECIES: carbohydrate porin [Kuenenia]MBE7548171.1 porin [Planctomycetia bacterium]MBW7941821.1 porin [Candidatus Kuenenia stuttgartiensis]MBZ0192708.1 porin [Candidatus Kuenenia stuttgartiensis]MCF6152604.1 porin [Candidatus Kuenenia stuttgartiensis]MCL4726892.1 outer membrane beta-barrel protein [Candidatus Kuenenia stuttgartiensis]